MILTMLGEDTNWVLNVRAAGGRAVLRHGRREAVRLEDVDPPARPPILRRYLACAPGARAHIPVDRHAPLEEFEEIALQVPVFRITTARAAHMPQVERPERRPPPPRRTDARTVSPGARGVCTTRSCPPIRRAPAKLVPPTP